MNFQNPEVIELGLAEELVKDVEDLENSEGSMPSRIKLLMSVYVADAE